MVIVYNGYVIVYNGYVIVYKVIVYNGYVIVYNGYVIVYTGNVMVYKVIVYTGYVIVYNGCSLGSSADTWSDGRDVDLQCVLHNDLGRAYWPTTTVTADEAGNYGYRYWKYKPCLIRGYVRLKNTTWYRVKGQSRYLDQ